MQGGEAEAAARVDGERVGKFEPLVRPKQRPLWHGAAFGLRWVVVKEVQREVTRHGVVQGQLHGEGLPALLYGAVVATDAEIRFFPPKQQGAGHEQHQPGGEQSPVQRERGIKPDKQGLDKGECYPAAPLVFVRDDHCRGTGTVCRSCASRASVLMSSISASAERCTRWRRTAGASALMSSGIT